MTASRSAADSKSILKLMDELKDLSIALATLEVEVSGLASRVTEYSGVIKELNDEITELTIKIALLEQTILYLKKKAESQDKDRKELTVADRTGRWHLIAVGVTGLLGLVIALINLIVK